MNFLDSKHHLSPDGLRTGRGPTASRAEAMSPGKLARGAERRCVRGWVERGGTDFGFLEDGSCIYLSLGDSIHPSLGYFLQDDCGISDDSVMT